MSVESKYCVPYNLELWHSERPCHHVWSARLKLNLPYELNVNLYLSATSPRATVEGFLWDISRNEYKGAFPHRSFENVSPETLAKALKLICDDVVEEAVGLYDDSYATLSLGALKRLWHAHLDRVSAFEGFGYWDGPLDGSPPHAAERPVLVVSGPSGVGKDAVVDALSRRSQGAFEKCVTCTTRMPREGELDGADYHFMDRDGFEEAVRDGKFLEHAEVHGNLYGTPIHEIDRVLSHGAVPVLILDPQGLAALKAKGVEAFGVLIEPPSEKALEERLRGRGTEDRISFSRRMTDAQAIQAEAGNYDARVANVTVSQCARDIERAYGKAIGVIAKLGGKDMERERTVAAEPSVRAGFDLKAETEAVWDKYFESLDAKGEHWDFPEDFIASLGYAGAELEALTKAFVYEQHEDSDPDLQAEIYEEYGIDHAWLKDAGMLSPIDSLSDQPARRPSAQPLAAPKRCDAR